MMNSRRKSLALRQGLLYAPGGISAAEKLSLKTTINEVITSATIRN
jgi:hypothetical protein